MAVKSKRYFKVIALLMCVFVLSASNVYAAGTLDEQKEDLEEKQEQIEADIARVQAELDALEADESAALEYQELLYEKINLIEERVMARINSINALNDTIAELDAQIEVAEIEYADTLEQLKERITVLYQSGSISTLEVLLDSTSLHDFAYKNEMLKATASFDKELMDKITEFVNITKDDRAERDAQKEEVANEKKELEADKEELSILYVENEDLIAELKSLQLLKEEDIEFLENENAEYNAQIAEIIEEQKRLEEEARKAAEEAAKNPSAVPPGGYVSDGDFDPVWPIPGYGYGSITQAYRYGGHYGLDVGIPMMTQIIAVDDGRVASAEYRWDWGNNVLVYHNSTYSTRYAHLQTMTVSAGQHVVKGQVIGYSGSTGQSTGPHLHFEIYQNGSRIDPQIFI